MVFERLEKIAESTKALMKDPKLAVTLFALGTTGCATTNNYNFFFVQDKNGNIERVVSDVTIVQNDAFRRYTGAIGRNFRHNGAIYRLKDVDGYGLSFQLISGRGGTYFRLGWNDRQIRGFNPYGWQWTTRPTVEERIIRAQTMVK